MDDRLNAWLDGELADEELGAEERLEARRLRDALHLAEEAATHRSPGLAGGVMARVASARAPRRGFLTRVRGTFSLQGHALRPAAVVGALCLAVGFGLGTLSRPDAAPAPVTTVAADAAPTVFVRFDVRLEGARTVHLAGSFSEWQPAYEMTEAGDQHWTVTVPLDPGVHDYVFVVDGEEHVLDPAAPQIADGFGSYSNRIALLTSAT